MPTLTLAHLDAAELEVDVLVVGVTAAAPGSSDGPRLAGDALPEQARDRLQGSLRALGVTGAPDSVLRVPSAGAVRAPVLALTGLGAPPSDGTATSPEVLRRAAGAAARSLTGVASAGFALPAGDPAAVAAVAEGALLGAYAYTRYRSTGSTGSTTAAAGAADPAVLSRQPLGAVTVLAAPDAVGDVDAVTNRSQVLAASVHAVRDMVNASPSDLYPSSFADAAVAAVADLPVEVTVLDETQLTEGGYGGLVGVGMGSSRPPRLVHLDYRPEGAAVHVALVGKGITFDSGGLSIKPAAGMEAMKSDMSGAAAVLHTVVAAARLGLPVRVDGWLALAENMPSGSAQRPSDVITIRGGKTVEVLNTDAEGRLVLADALVAAGETGPDLIVDVATLTGAQMVALGNRVSAVMANDDDLRSRLHALADTAGEQIWPMPLPPELRASLDSPVADLANIGDRFGGMLVAGLFLAEFVPHRDGEPGVRVPWAHLDIAGPAFNTGSAHGYTPVGGTGTSVRTLLALLEDVAASGLETVTPAGA